MSQGEFDVSQEEIDQALEEADDRARALVRKLRDGLSAQAKETKRLQGIEKEWTQAQAKQQEAEARATLAAVLGTEPSDRQMAAYIRDETPDAATWAVEMGYSTQTPTPAPAGETPEAKVSTQQPTPPNWQPTPSGTPTGPPVIPKKEFKDLARKDWNQARALLAEGRVEGFEELAGQG